MTWSIRTIAAGAALTIVGLPVGTLVVGEVVIPAITAWEELGQDLAASSDQVAEVLESRRHLMQLANKAGASACGAEFDQINTLFVEVNLNAVTCTANAANTQLTN